MTEQNRSSFAVVTFYTTSALVTALGLAILITGAVLRGGQDRAGPKGPATVC